MNKYEKEVQQSLLNSEKGIINNLEGIYNKALKDIGDKIAMLLGRNDNENLQTIVYQLEYQKALKKQINAILDEMNTNQFTSISEYLTKCYEDGYVGAMYSIHKQGIPIIAPINQKLVVKALQLDSKISESLYTSLQKNVNVLKNTIRTQISRGMANNYSYGKIAQELNAQTKIGLNKSIRIARTEGHRIQEQSSMDAAYKAKEKGADVVKQWNASRDSRTRPLHRKLDGQIKELDEFFEVNGFKAKQPSGFGVPHMDINCRCNILTRAKWELDEDELDELKKRAEFFGLDKTDDFEDFKKKYLNAAKNYSGNANDNLTNNPNGGKNILEMQSYEEVEDYFKSNYDIPFDSKLKDFNLDSIKDSTQGVEDMLQMFPDAKNQIKGFSIAHYDEGDDEGVMDTTWDGFIRFNPKMYKDMPRKEFLEQYNGVAIGHHEVGHILESLIYKKWSPNSGVEKIKDAWNTSYVAKMIYSTAYDNLDDELKQIGHTALKASISNYALDDYSETLAEAVRDYMANGDDASPLSIEIFKIIRKELG